MAESGLTIKHLVFTGPQVEPAELVFKAGLNLVYGASNTGKSFILKSIDFMLGGSTVLPEFKERDGYDTLWFGFSLAGISDFTLSRAINGGSYSLYKELVTSATVGQNARTLLAKHDAKNSDNISQFLLGHLGFVGKRIAKNPSGETNNLSFRDLASILLVDETSIQIERSPIESVLGKTTAIKERSVFRFLITGLDDSAIIPVLTPATFKTSKTVRVEVIEDLISEVDVKLTTCYPDFDSLPAQNDLLAITLDKIQTEFVMVQGSVRKLVEDKQRLSIKIPQIGERLEEIQIHLERFAQLENIYSSDIERLYALEEAGFLLSLESARACSLCGAPPEAQKHTDALSSIEQVRDASLIEINKIEGQRKDLAVSVIDLRREHEFLSAEFYSLKQRLVEVEEEIASLAPKVNESRDILRDVIIKRDHIKQGLALLEQRKNLVVKLQEFKKLKKPSKDEKPNLELPAASVYEFSKIVSQVLTAWEFPGERHVIFDKNTYDLIIDGKLRINNGKGVRAVTHAAFKVALLLFCKERNFPHPGFVVLDTPLLTYRDPMKNPKEGELQEDEKALAQTTLKQRFFEHLSSISHLGQFIILENIDPPANIDDVAHVQAFYGNTGGGRNGVFPVSNTN